MRKRAARAAVVLVGLLLPQVAVYWSSLVGSEVLLPLDVLADDGVYLPRDTPITVHNPVLADPVYQIGPPFLEFMRRELATGRMPVWIPDIYCGAPFASSGRFSAFALIYYLWPSPHAFAWMQLAKALVTGLGAYLFFRKAMGAGFGAAAAGAWCWPWTAFFVFWQGYGLTQVVAWFPWLLLAADATIRRRGGWSVPALAAATCLTCNGGQLDIAGLALIACGLYAVWRLADAWRTCMSGRQALRAGGALLAGWGMGLCLSAPAILPLVDYCRAGARFISRGAGAEDRPPEGLAAMAQVVLPYVYGSSQYGSTRIGSTNVLESAAAGYAGLLAVCLGVPLAWWNRRLLATNLCWLALAAISFTWVAGLPVAVDVLRLKGLNWFSWNRFVFLGAFSILAMAVAGLDALSAGPARRRIWGLAPAAATLLLGLWCLTRAVHLPESTERLIAADAPQRAARWRMTSAEAQSLITGTYRRHYWFGAGLCAVGLAGWAAFIAGSAGRRAAIAAGLAMCGELAVWGHDFNPQCDRSLYYPPVAALEAVKSRGAPGRILGVECLPPNLALMHGLADVRGYDGTDPRLIIEVMELARRPGSMCWPFARTLVFVPQMEFRGDEAIVHPVLSMLGVRYIVLRKPPPPGVRLFYEDGDWFVVENRRAMPRTYVPRAVVAADESECLRRLGSWDFDPAVVAYATGPARAATQIRGESRIIEETPCRVVIAARMETPGLVILADQWDKGWRASVDGRRAEVMRVNHALRGVAVDAGEHTVVLEYRPTVYTISMALAAAGGCAMAAWIVALGVRRLAATRPGRLRAET